MSAARTSTTIDLTAPALAGLLEAVAAVARADDLAERRRLVWGQLEALLDAELLAVWLGVRGEPTARKLRAARQALVLGLTRRARDPSTSPPAVARTPVALVAVWSPAAKAVTGAALLTTLAGWIASSVVPLAGRTSAGLRSAGRDPTLHDVTTGQARPELIERLARLASGAAPVEARARDDALTSRERQVAREVAAGRTNAEIAAALDLSEHTVKQHLKQAFRKLGVARRAGLVRALERGA